MSSTTDQIIINNKPIVVSTNSTYLDKEAYNDVSLNEINTTTDQLDTFIKLLPQDYVEFVNNEQIIKQIYLNGYSRLFQLFFSAQEESVFTKTKEDLNADFDGPTLLQNLNFFQILDIQKLKDDLLNDLNNDPCLVMNVQQPTTVLPLQKELIKTNLRLGCRTHILDFKLRNITLSTVFDNSEFYANDNTLSNYLFDLFIERIKNTSISYYQSMNLIMGEEIESLSENGSELVDPVTTKKVEFIYPLDTVNSEQNLLIYLKYVFDQEFINISNNLNSFLKMKISKNGVKISLSDLITTKQFFINNCKTVGTNQLRLVENYELFFYVEIENTSINSNCTISLSIKSPLSTGQQAVKLISARKFTIPSTTATISDVSQEQILDSIQQIQSNSKFDTMFDFVFPLQKMLNVCSISNILMCSNYYPNSNDSFEGSFKTIFNIHKSISNSGDQNLCDELENPNSSFGFELEIAKIIAQTPIQIIKSLEETYDPNIVIANLLKKAAESVGAPDLSIIPYSSWLMAPPPVGPAIPVVPPFGFIYWGISAAETISNTAKGNNSFGFEFDISGMDIKFKNPFNSKC
jgi:hypothetical protein